MFKSKNALELDIDIKLTEVNNSNKPVAVQPSSKPNIVADYGYNKNEKNKNITKSNSLDVALSANVSRNAKLFKKKSKKRPDDSPKLLASHDAKVEILSSEEEKATVNTPRRKTKIFRMKSKKQVNFKYDKGKEQSTLQKNWLKNDIANKFSFKVKSQSEKPQRQSQKSTKSTHLSTGSQVQVKAGFFAFLRKKKTDQESFSDATMKKSVRRNTLT